MDLSKVKVGDEVYSCLKGWMPVLAKDESRKFCLETERDVYMIDGRASDEDINPEITDWKPKKREWKPSVKSNRGYEICPNGAFRWTLHADIDWVKEGRAYNTKDQVEYAYKSIRACQILNAYVAEFAPDWRADWNDNRQDKYFVFYNHDSELWDKSWSIQQQFPGLVYMPRAIAEQLREDLNDGVVKL